MLDYNTIYSTYYSKLLVLFKKQIKDKDEAEDLVQDTLLKIHENLSSYDDKYALATWVYSIAFNTLKNYYRKQKDFIQYSPEVYDNESTLSYTDPADILSAEETEASYLSALSDMDEKYLEVYAMKEVDGMSYKDIASALNVPEGTVKSRLNRARDFIKKGVLCP